MRSIGFKKNQLKQAQQGFTLVELVVVILVLGIVSLAAAPRFFSTNTYVENAFAKRLQASLRSLQTQSMYDTRSGFCYQLNVTSSAFGPPTDNYQTGNETQSCASTIDITVASHLRTDAGEVSAQNLSISPLDSGATTSYIRFDSLGRPATSIGSCLNTCQFTISGGDSASVCVNSQGYIYDC